ncbi:hypothetical protein MMC18_000875 [Xylographa bjoerkii]|nr:hypothetical protein [Xylographa bjoerkii]
MQYLWNALFFSLLTHLQCTAVPIASHNQNSLRDHVRSADSVSAALKRAEVIPDVLDDFTPTFALSLSYTFAHKTVSLGNNIHPSDTSSRPVFEIHRLSSTTTLSPTRTLDSNRTYTVVLTDPDATSRADPTKSQMCHWIVTAVAISATNASEGIDEANAYTLEMSPHSKGIVGTDIHQLIEYMPPAPPKGTGKHRYVFVLLALEDEGNGREELSKPKDRPHWGYGAVGKGVREWATENSLVPVGMYCANLQMRGQNPANDHSGKFLLREGRQEALALAQKDQRFLQADKEGQRTDAR